MQNEKLHLTQALRDITQVVLQIRTRKGECGANFTYILKENFHGKEINKLHKNQFNMSKYSSLFSEQLFDKYSTCLS